jgi:hypothetical protein
MDSAYVASSSGVEPMHTLVIYAAHTPNRRVLIQCLATWTARALYSGDSAS